MVKFGTGGWRAIIGDEFTKLNVQCLAAGLSQKMKDENVAEKGVVIGYDRRFLSDESAYWAAEVFAGAGIPCKVIDKASPTPLIMYEVKENKYPYGLCVTASHNPAVYNGIKVFVDGGRDADESITDIIEQYVEKIDPNCIPVMDYKLGLESGIIEIINPFNRYIDSIISAVDMDAIRKANMKVVLDPMYGVSKTSLMTILLTARCDVDVIHERHDALFGGRTPTPTEKALSSLINFVEENKCHIGIATDGDADRLGVIDDNCNFMHPNQILALLYYYLVKYKGWEGDAVRNIATTHLMDRLAEHFGYDCHEVPVGFKYISSKMVETNAVIGGESSGGLTVRGHIQGKDGVYAAALLVEMIAATGRALTEIYKEITDQFGEFYMAEHSYRFPAVDKPEIVDLLMVQKKLPDYALEIEKVSYMDGCKIYFKNGGWIIARFSGTEPLIRVFCEQSTLEQAEEVCETMRVFLGVEDEQ